jgi:hypothetical protein
LVLAKKQAEELTAWVTDPKVWGFIPSYSEQLLVSGKLFVFLQRGCGCGDRRFLVFRRGQMPEDISK